MLLVFSHKNLATPVQCLPLDDDSHFNAGMVAGDCLYLSIWKTLYIYQLKESAHHPLTYLNYLNASDDIYKMAIFG